MHISEELAGSKLTLALVGKIIRALGPGSCLRASRPCVGWLDGAETIFIEGRNHDMMKLSIAQWSPKTPGI
jgi:hypothetical protein